MVDLKIKIKKTLLGFFTWKLSQSDEKKEGRLLYKTVAHICITLYIPLLVLKDVTYILRLLDNTLV